MNTIRPSADLERSRRQTAPRHGGNSFSTPRWNAARCFVFAVMIPLVTGGALRAASWSQGTGLFGNITLGALQNPAVVNRT